MNTLIQKINQSGVEKFFKVQYTGSNLKVTPKFIPKAYRILAAVCEVISLKNVPDLYIRQGDDINSITIGSEAPIIVINQGCLEKLTNLELMFLLGHEVGHIKSQHCAYHQMAMAFPIISNLLGKATLGVGEFVSMGIRSALLAWRRKSEFTGDRAGLLACQSIESAITIMMKMAGAPESHYNSLDPQDFLDQTEHFEGLGEDNLDLLAKVLSSDEESHPWTVTRCHEISKWVDSGNYDRVIENHSKPALQKQSESEHASKTSAKCGKRVRD
ncbi:MAG: M48 family metallopeptidase [Candidatus Wallbacteria bacterium]|nr:M48 family metallopeptidase [Candidatus Wallbacteria bacterium]